MIKANLLFPIPYFNTLATIIAWKISYPSNIAEYQLLDIYNNILTKGSYQVPQSIVDSWGPDDSVITDAIVAAAPWNVYIPTTTTTTSTII